MGLVPSCHCAFVDPKLLLVSIWGVQSFFLVGISWVQNVFRWYFVNTKALSLVFRGSEDFTGRFLVGPKISSLGKWWVLNFFLWVTREYK